jgi:hypothetical protein
MSLNIGRRGRLYGKKESAYGTLQTILAANALRHIDFQANFDPFNRVNSPEKKDSPGTVNLFDRRTTAGLGSLVALARPSGTLNTVPEADFIYEAGFGSKHNVTLATTIAVGGAGTTTADTFTSATGLAVGDAVLFNHQDGKKYVRFLQTVDTGTGVATWAPALPSPLNDGQAAKGCLTYSLTTDLAISVMFLHVLTGFRREERGIGIDKLAFTFDANEEPRFTASGPGQQELSEAAAIADPGGFTSVGGNPPSGLVGDLYINDTAYLFKKLDFDITNALKVRNDEYGTSVATEVYREGRRVVSLSLAAFVETAATLQALAKAGTMASLMKQTGRTEGNIVAVYFPKIDWKVPDTSTGDNALDWTFKGTAIETADGGNDEVRFALA